MKPTLIITKDTTQRFNEIIKKLKSGKVLVGIPSEENPREDEQGDIGNAALLAINHFGSEAAHIPPRPVLTIGIKLAQKEIAEEFRQAGQAVWKQEQAALDRHYERAGIVASNSCKQVINSQIEISPPSPATIKARRYLTKAGFKGIKSLLVTGQLRNAITYVVRNS